MKGGIEIYLDGIKGVFGAQSVDIDDTISVVNEIFAVTKEFLDLDLSKYVTFFEFEVNANYHMSKDVYMMTASLFQDSTDMNKLRQILRGDYALKLTPSGKNINNKEWYDITIEPKVNSTGNIFTVRILS